MSPATTIAPRATHCRPDPSADLGFFLAENLLSARANSMFPTNGAGPDEDVNVYLIHLLRQFLRGHHDPRVRFASGVLFNPPEAMGRRQSAEYYRVNGDHRLLHLGLFDRGDGIRRRTTLYRLSSAETRRRDLSAGRVCYEQAANMLRHQAGPASALVDIFDKLAGNFEDYVHVLGALATRNLGFQAVLDEISLSRLLAPVPGEDTRAVADLLAASPPQAALDTFLDLWLVHKNQPTASTARRLAAMARQLGFENPIYS